jgi:hypothetical protein
VQSASAITLLLIVSTLSACGSKSDKPAAASGEAAAPASPPPAAEASPRRKAGLWRIAMSSPEMPSAMPAMEECVDEATEAKSSGLTATAPGDQCEKQSFVRNADGSVTFSAVCKTAGGEQTDTHGTVTGDFSSHYQMDLVSVVSGSKDPSANGSHKMTLTGTYAGACPPAGADKGRTMTLPDGRKMKIPSGLQP